MALCLLLPALLLVAPVALAIRIAAPGPVLYRQMREGRDGVGFMMFKLRTMHVDAPAILAQVLERDRDAAAEWRRYARLTNDPRIAGRAGLFARKWSIDELPQLINVVAGEMNLVGPRPLPLDIVATLPAERRRIRQAVAPGITGLWQVSGRSDLTLDEMSELDCRYVRDRSIRLDSRILLATIPAVISHKGAY